ncbi:hypothetical protein TD95_002836 [Thielaviopsis punctulata]|uniref:Dolichyldiphosphatase n=1 Tax=Thielaviopsis punctulata TaxID=72032 RepID=A0A0F4ZFZ5_9PEZI|nr:hypothetical protein TD95_002836 [Thielaviopsis punctulata]
MASVDDVMAPLASFSLTHDPSDIFSHLSAFLALVPHALIVAYSTLIIATREAEVVLMLAGQLSCEAANFVLKRIIKEERPNELFGKGYGMPSSHAQFMAFWSVTVLLFLGVRHASPHSAPRSVPLLERVLAGTGAVALAAGVAVSRVYLGYHTPKQVLAGVAAGVVCAFGWFGVTAVARSSGLVAWGLELPPARWLRVRDLLNEEEPAAAGWDKWEEMRAAQQGKKRQ